MCEDYYTKKAEGVTIGRRHSDQFLGKFNEIEKCRSELVTILNRMKRDLK